MTSTPSFSFGENFLRDHAGLILDDPRVALIELVANAYDAGATRVDIGLPADIGETLTVVDNGTGMTTAEFERRWTQFSYSRLKEQGETVAFPPEVKGLSRRAFGRNGKGRHAAFCFGDAYYVVTWQGGVVTEAKVTRLASAEKPLECEYLPGQSRDGHGTQIRVVVDRHLLPAPVVAGLVGNKFVADPSVRVLVNGNEVLLTQLAGVDREVVTVPGVGEVVVSHVDGGVTDRIVKLRGIAWWVNQRMVGEPSWEGLDGEGAYLDGRSAEAKRHSFIVEADLLKNDVKADWTGLHAGQRVNAVRDAVHSNVLKRLQGVMSARRKERKKAALEDNCRLLGDLATDSRVAVGAFVDQVLERCTSISEKDLARLVLVVGNLEHSRSGYDLLGKLARCSPDDLDAWNTLMETWTADQARIVLGELERRLKLIAELEALAHDATADELHDLQPIFERGLWMFGPEYEAVDFKSNRTLATVVKNFLGGLDDGETLPGRRRPDFVALPNASIGLYGAYAYGAEGEIVGVRKVLVVELKKGAFDVTQKEVDQARDYSRSFANRITSRKRRRSTLMSWARRSPTASRR